MIRALVLIALCATPAAAQQLRLEFPLNCVLGQSCYIQNYVDRDPSPDHRDFGCGNLGYDGHRGTDIALIDLAAMKRGVNVYPAAPGTVSATRDGMQDISINDPNAPDITNRSCGNAVIIQHENGWETRYCHMKRSSVAVRTGDTVTPNTVLGQVGLSGATEFPHLHIAVLKDGDILDPFQPNGATTCGAVDHSLWADDITYISGGLISAGFATGIPKFDEIKRGTAHSDSIRPNAPALVIWGHMFGGRVGDVMELEIIGPNGPFMTKSVTLEKTQARLFRAVGRNRRDAVWPVGTYTGTIRLLRNGQEIDHMTTSVEMAG